METTLIAITGIGIAFAMICSAIGVYYLELSLLAALMLYSLSGAAFTLFAGWRRYRCVTLHEYAKQG